MEKKKFETRRKLIVELLGSEMYVPMKIKELSAFMQVPKADKEAFREVVDSLIEDGSISVTQKGKLILPEPGMTGTFEAHSGGFGFVTAEGRDTDIFIPEDRVHSAMHGDTVEFKILHEARPGKREEGEITKIVKRGTEEIVGTYRKGNKGRKGGEAGFGFVVPDNGRFVYDVFVSKERSKGALDGQKVVVRITDYGDPDRDKKPEGIISEILGDPDDRGVDILSIVRAYGLPEEFPDDVLAQADRVAKPVSDADRAFRKDLRDLVCVTIDGEEAKDFDDAVSLTMDGSNYKLGVHIADVTNYVQENSALDREALNRGTSVYLTDRVIPMLPVKLSNGICSLNPHEDRLTLSCLMTIDSTGKVIDSEIAESVINSNRRMTYTEVKDLLEGTASPELAEECRELTPMFVKMAELASILRERRRKRGSIDFDFPETKIILDEEGHPVDIRPYDRNVATKLIEDFMLIANETVAETCCYEELPFVYRSHENPDQEKIDRLGLFINNFGYHIHIAHDEIHPKELQKLLEQIDGTPEEALISRLTLRSMKQAKYTTEPLGHFGLACQYYCHFTSPIRRYPDLQIHRIIKENLRGKLADKRLKHYGEILQGVADRSSKLERRADEAERETDKLKKVEYMSAHIGETYEGVISGVTDWGIYVELPNTVEGMIALRDLNDDYYEYDEAAYQVKGRSTGKTYKLGQRLKVTVLRADKFLREIDFEAADDDKTETATEGDE